MPKEAMIENGSGYSWAVEITIPIADDRLYLKLTGPQSLVLSVLRALQGQLEEKLAWSSRTLKPEDYDELIEEVGTLSSCMNEGAFRDIDRRYLKIYRVQGSE
jgi:hypothetical protein